MISIITPKEKRMHRFIIALLACIGVAIVGPSFNGASAKAADEKKKADLLVGKWEVVKSAEEVPPGTILEFKADGTMTITISANGKSLTLEGTYKHEGDKITHMMKGETGKPEVETIKELKDDKLVTTGKDGKETEFKKKK
jgi:uncharacterized protein (TIGR03066 family)